MYFNVTHVITSVVSHEISNKADLKAQISRKFHVVCILELSSRWC